MIKVIDAICGAGKTSYAIQYMNQNPNKLFIYVTPFLSEVQRIKEQTLLEFFEPKSKNGKGKKIEHVKSLLEECSNIIMTHELYARLDEEMLFTIKREGYILIMDEVANVLNSEYIPKDDIRMMSNNNIIEIQEDGLIIWKDLLYSGTFSYLKVLCQRKNLFLHNNSFLFWTMPVENFNSFEEVFILTYLFDGQIQKYYYDMHNVQYEKYSVIKNEIGFELTQYDKSLEPRELIGKLLTIYEDHQPKTGRKSLANTNYLIKKNNPEKALSKSWYDHAEAEQIKQLKNNLVTIFRNRVPVLNEKIFWTTFKNQAPLLKNVKCKLDSKDERSKDNYLPFNTRATNDYGDRSATAFMINRFMNPNESQFFSQRGIKVDEDLLAISDLIQYLFRGCIRNNEPMYCYIPSSRMRKLLNQWISFEI